MVFLVLGGVGLLIGIFFEIQTLRKRVAKLEEDMKAAMPQAEETRTPASVPYAPPSQHVLKPQTVVSRSVRESVDKGRDERKFSFDRPAASETSDSSVAEPVPVATPSERAETGKHAFPDIAGRLSDYVKTFFTTGNVVTKIGVIILFFGFAFLLKYAAQRDWISIEFRLIGVFLGGLGLLGAGWRLRERRMIYGLLLQGGGVGVLYLTVYAAARFYHLLPYGLAFAVMFSLVILSGILAVLQNAKSLAIFGIIGGFLAPVLMSTDGNHVVLFSYYALLNLGIVIIAWHKAWRELNLIGFVFTFVIASLWGGKYYQPRYFYSTEPFLILFFLCYVAISVLHALRQPVNLKGYVDGTLVFGVPLVAFGLQYALVKDFEYGLAMSALSLGLFYILLATILQRRRMDGLRMLTESYLAFGIVFGSLAIPLALDGRWTSAAWALEGGAILWIGIRQNRLLPRIFGVLLQAGSGISFLMATHLPSGPIPIANSFFVGCILISLAGLFSGWYLTNKSEFLYEWERHAAIPLMIWGLVWWFGAALFEIDRFVAVQDRITVAVIHAAVSFMLIDIASRRLAWKEFSYPPLILMPVMGLASIYHLAGAGDVHLFARMGYVAWGVAFCVQYRLLFTCEKVWPEKVVTLWHQFTLWLLLFILTWESSYGIGLLVQEGRTWQYCAWGVVPGAAVLALLSKGDRLSWPVCRFREAYFGMGTALPVAYLFCWAVLVNLYHGDPAPLPFVPVVNPVELTQLYLLLLVLHWIGHRETRLRRFYDSLNGPVSKMIVYGAGFLLLNTTAARAIHFWAQVPYTAGGLFRSALFQATISILWGVTALLTTLGATRKGSRPAWIAGASILSLVVIKLFIVDLAGTGTVARIVSFLFVGSLMLLIGYFSPIPPARNKEVS